MIIYNVTVSIDNSIEQEWLSWMRTKHIPDVMSTQAFRECKLSRLLTGEEQGGKAYSVMYVAFSREHLDQYQKEHAYKLQEEHSRKYQGKFAAFRTELKIVEEFYHEG
ncbi:MAG: DUF4286 family protein [Crocinitomicaceae bacterium]|nr:DUF4286 family protein [Crocinitomicaceae bacterium]